MGKQASGFRLRASRGAAALLLLALALAARQAPAQVQNFGAATFTTNVTLTTTSETVMVSSGPVTMRRANCQVFVMGCAQLTTGTATTTVTPRIRRGTTATGTLVGEANAVTIGAAVGSTEQFCGYAVEERSNEASVEYSLTLTQASATGNGTALYGFVLVLMF